ncbi:cyclopropane-fatty-acyl-phospholipid synthase family protein [Uliginosibacterium sp. TH139]|uniref:SAM-dependent methyltransferase n=2 Tax=unclassified Uliginosibacterium TaxID=2621521 RepID=UPI000C7D6453|nr:SAM-dependent methyltransferase [Uliginosibacterium sp. TH139]
MNARSDGSVINAAELSPTLPALRRKPSRAMRLLLDMLARIEGGSLLLRLPDGSSHLLGSGPQAATLTLHDEAVFGRILAAGSIGFAEAFMDGAWETDHLPALLTLLAQNRAVLERAIHGNALRLAGHWLWHRLRANTRRGSKKNIEAHYDLGNDFYRLWLDRTMSYSSALWPTPDASFEEAQLEKYRHALRSIGVQPGQHILEIGCGWGGLAEVACKEFGARVSGVTLSHEQLAWARERAEREGFADRAEFKLCDYRDLTGQYDHIVSIEMIEAVGEAFWPSYFAQLRALLKPGGRAVVQAITIDNRLFAHYRKDVDFIQRYIFPGGMLPSPEVFRAQSAKAGLQPVAERAFGLDYARTLNEWLQRFNAQLDAVHAQGFDARFVRMWQFYLGYCEAGFRARNTDVWQYVLSHRGA